MSILDLIEYFPSPSVLSEPEETFEGAIVEATDNGAEILCAPDKIIKQKEKQELRKRLRERALLLKTFQHDHMRSIETKHPEDWNRVWRRHYKLMPDADTSEQRLYDALCKSQTKAFKRRAVLRKKLPFLARRDKASLSITDPKIRKLTMLFLSAEKRARRRLKVIQLHRMRHVLIEDKVKSWITKNTPSTLPCKKSLFYVKQFFSSLNHAFPMRDDRGPFEIHDLRIHSLDDDDEDADQVLQCRSSFDEEERAISALQHRLSRDPIKILEAFHLYPGLVPKCSLPYDRSIVAVMDENIGKYMTARDPPIWHPSRTFGDDEE